MPFKWAETPAPCDPADVLLLADVCYREDAVPARLTEGYRSVSLWSAFNGGSILPMTF